MANTKSAKKQARQNVKRRQINLARKTAIKSAIKKVMSAIENNEPIEVAKKYFTDVQAKLARAKSKGVLHANTVQRKISTLAKKVTQAEKRESK